MQAYSIDLRKRVRKFIEEGNSQQSATKIYNLNKATANRWWQRYKKEGHVNPRMNLGRKAKIDKAELKKYVDAHPDSRLCDISLKFMVSINAIHRWLKKLGYSYKKKAFTYVEASEEKRNAYQETIKDISPRSLVYIDERGIELKICKDRGWGKKGEKLVAKKSGKYYERTNIIACVFRSKSNAISAPNRMMIPF